MAEQPDAPVPRTQSPVVRLPRKPEACWEWLAAVDDAGYARKSYDGRSLTAARWMWETLYGQVPPGLEVTATCGNRQCCNPHHLVMQARAEITRRGVAATLTVADVQAIKQAKKTRTLNTASVLADRYGVRPGAIRDIWRGHTWGRKRRTGEYQPKRSAAADKEAPRHG